MLNHQSIDTTISSKERSMEQPRIQCMPIENGRSERSAQKEKKMENSKAIKAKARVLLIMLCERTAHSHDQC